MINGINQWRILKNYGDILYIRLFGQTTKQLSSNYKPWKPGKCKQVWDLGTWP